MNLEALIAECRRLTDDYSEPPLWSDPEFTSHLNEAEREACVRARLLVSDEGAPSEMTLSAGERRHKLHPLIIDVLEARTEAGDAFSGWTLDETHMIVDRAPDDDVNLILTVQRYPLREMSDKEHSPEIRSSHHLSLVQWALHLAYMKRDAETFQPDRAGRHEAEFERYFGRRPTANVVRKQRRKTARVVRMNPF